MDWKCLECDAENNTPDGLLVDENGVLDEYAVVICNSCNASFLVQEIRDEV